MTLGRPPARDDLEALRVVMDANASPGTLTFAEVPGFLFAVVCAPETVPPSEWLAEILGEDPTFDDARHADRVLGALMAWYNEINSGVLERRPRLPEGYSFRYDVLENFDPGSPMAAWCRGFFRGHVWLAEVWEEYLFEEIEEEAFACVFGLSLFYSRERAQEAAEDESRTLEELATLVRELFHDSMAGYANLGRSIHEALMELDAEDASPRRPFVAEPTVGRNDPCSCGSGRKHKKCCGKHVH